MRLETTLLALFILLVTGSAISQTPAAAPPLQVKEGWWNLTITNHVSQKIPEETLNSLPPETRKQLLDQLKADEQKGQTSNIPFCLTHAHRLSGLIFDVNDNSCDKQVTSNGQRSEIRLQCGESVTDTIFERTSDEGFRGTQTALPAGGRDGSIRSTFSAKLLAPDCAAVAAAQAKTWYDAQHFDPDVQKSMPYTAGVNRFGPYFAYNYAYGKVPRPVYIGHIPGLVPTGAEAMFHGTDGSYFYITVPAPYEGNWCIPPGTLIRIDKNGLNPVRVNQVPAGLHGGEKPPAFCKTLPASSAAAPGDEHYTYRPTMADTRLSDLEFPLPPGTFMPAGVIGFDPEHAIVYGNAQSPNAWAYVYNSRTKVYRPIGFEGTLATGKPVHVTLIAAMNNNAEVIALSDAGVVYGTVALGPPNTTAIPRSKGSFHALECPKHLATAATGLNNAGQIIGTCGGSGRSPDEPMFQGFLYSGGTFRLFSDPKGLATFPEAINDAGVIVGNYQPGYYDPAMHQWRQKTMDRTGFVLKDGKFADIYPEPDNKDSNIEILNINDKGELLVNNVRGGRYIGYPR